MKRGKRLRKKHEWAELISHNSAGRALQNGGNHGGTTLDAGFVHELDNLGEGAMVGRFERHDVRREAKRSRLWEGKRDVKGVKKGRKWEGGVMMGRRDSLRIEDVKTSGRKRIL
jgi:hypothetical protein